MKYILIFISISFISCSAQSAEKSAGGVANNAQSIMRSIWKSPEEPTVVKGEGEKDLDEETP